MSKKILERRDEFFLSALDSDEACIKEWSNDAALFLDQGKYSKAVFWDRHWGNFSFFAECGQSLRHLDLYNNDKMISGIAHLKYLEHLIVRFKNKDSFDYTSLPNLKTLEFIWCAKSGLSALSHPTLKNMSIDYLPDKDFQPMNTSLESLFLVTSKMKHFSFLQNFSELKGIRVQGSKHIESLEGLPASLERLWIDDKTNLVNFEYLKKLRQLKSLTLRASVTLSKIPKELYDLPLEKLVWLCEPVSVEWNNLLQMKTLNHIAIKTTPTEALSESDIKKLCQENNREIENLTQHKGRKKCTTILTLNSL
ncbi:MAG: hypothetical protein QNK37_08500 [Acidobacteriota bacterium]|nr:hypothetical protein [Acidobacteriota bacterium]